MVCLHGAIFVESTVHVSGVGPPKNWQLNTAACSGKLSPSKSDVAAAIVRISWPSSLSGLCSRTVRLFCINRNHRRTYTTIGEACAACQTNATHLEDFVIMRNALKKVRLHVQAETYPRLRPL